jgi:hypothetical protein
MTTTRKATGINPRPTKTGNPVADRVASNERANKATRAGVREARKATPATATAEVPEATPAKAPAKKVTPAKASPVAAKTTKAAPAQPAKAEKVQPATFTLPAGYELKYDNGAYKLAKPHDRANGWLVICTAHGTTTNAPKAKEGDALGRKTARPSWCKQCS